MNFRGLGLLLVGIVWLGGKPFPLRAFASQPLQISQASVQVSPHQSITSQANSSSVCPAQLEPRINAILNRPTFQRVRWGIQVQPLAGEQVLFQREGDRFFIPASNAKLLTTAAALTQFGPQFRIRTVVYRVPEPGVNLRVGGRGDPSLTTAQLQNLASQIRSRGITQIDRLVIDDTYFSGDPVNPNWEWEDIQAGYGAPVNSLILNQNAIPLTLVPQAIGQPLRVVWDDPAEGQGWAIENQSRTVAANAPEFVAVGRDLGRPILRVLGQLRAGSEAEPVAIAVTNPTQTFLETFRRVLTNQGIMVRQTVIASTPTTAPQAEIAAVSSVPLSELLKEANGESNNLYTESLLRLLGTPPTPNSNSLESGLAGIRTVLNRLGVAADSHALRDGSGLARANLVTPGAMTQVLQAMARSSNAQVYRDSLAIAGESGTLRNRFRGTPVQGNFFGKTGAISGITALSGYLNPPTYPPLVVSILVNHFDQPVSAIRPAIDELVLLLGGLRQC